MSNSIFRIFNPGAPKEDPVQKRRGQLRRAQQTYRDRKDKYTKALERELADTRSREARLTGECEDLRIIVQNVVNILSQHGIDVPPEAQRLRTSGSGEPSHKIQVVETMPSSPQLFSPESLENYSLPRSRGIPATLTTNSDTSSPADGVQGSARICDLDQVTMGMEFVLKIEEPCLGHIHGDPQKPNEPDGHALTTSSQLLSISNHSTSTTYFNTSPACPSYHNTPTAILERLLSLAPDLSSDGAMTPIQAWNSLRSRPQFGGLNPKSFWALAEGLRDAVKCHGFGATIQHNAFEDLVYETLVLGQPF